MSKDNLLKKITFLALFSSLTLTSIISYSDSSLTVTADRKSTDFVKAVRERTVLSSYNQTPPTPEFRFDSYRSYGPFSSTARITTDILPIRVKTFSENLVVQVVSPETLQRTLEVKKVSYSAFRFEHSSKIVLLVDGQYRVFDSDDYDQNLVEKTTPLTWRLKSNNPRSINSYYFLESLRKATKLSLVPRDAYWSDYKGQKTKYKFSAKDYVFSFLATYFLTANYRYKDGGSPELDNYWYKQTNHRAFQGSSRTNWPNEYLLQFLEIDYRSFRDLESVTEHAPIEKITIDGKPFEVFSVYLETGAKPNSQMELFFKKQIVGGALFFPAPSAYIEEQSYKREDQSKYGEGIVKQIGYYWYAGSYKEMLFGGPYTVSAYEVIGDKGIQKETKNPNYWDKEWLRSKTSPDEVVNEYQKRDSENYSQALYTNFVQGLTPYLSFRHLNSQLQSRVVAGEDKNIPKELVRFTASSNTSWIPWYFQAVTSPAPSKDEQGRLDTSVYLFNDAFSRFMYGASLKVLASGLAKTFKSFFGDEQIAFRSLLIAGVNWAKAIFDQTSGQSIYNFTLAALDSRLEGKDQNSSRIKTTKDALELANTPFVVSKGKRAFDVPYADNLRFATESISQTEAYQGGGPQTFARIQEEMTSLLDGVYQRLAFSPTTKLNFVLNWYKFSWNEHETNSVENVMKTLNSLDKKGRLDIAFDKTAKERKEYIRKWRAGFSFTNPYGWGYDWEGNGSYLAAFLSHRLSFFIGFFAELARRSETDPNNPFPLMTRLAKLLKKGIESGEYKFSVPFEEWFDLTNGQSFLGAESISLPGIDADSEISKFLYRSEKEFTNEELVRLNVELSVLIGPKWNDTAHSSDPNIGSRTLWHRGYYSPERIPGDGLWLQDDHFDNVEEIVEK